MSVTLPISLALRGVEDVSEPGAVMIDREHLEAAGKVVDAARALLAIAPPEALEQLVGRVAVRNLRGAIATLDAGLARRANDD